MLHLLLSDFSVQGDRLESIEELSSSSSFAICAPRSYRADFDIQMISLASCHYASIGLGTAILCPRLLVIFQALHGEWDGSYMRINLTKSTSAVVFSMPLDWTIALKHLVSSLRGPPFSGERIAHAFR